jgi:predicted O-methyltransferase YrrM
MLIKALGISLLSTLVDSLGTPITFLVAFWSKLQVKLGAERLPISFKIWDLFNLSPVNYHYYQPVFKVSELSEDTWTKEDPLSGIDLNIEGQLALLQQFNYNADLEKFPLDKPKEDELKFYYNNWMFCSGDAEILYSLIRHFKPSRVIEIGSGFSTRIAKVAIDKNCSEGEISQHICIEPYEAPWLEKLGVDQVIREKVESLPISYFQSLEKNDILFIDSSHVVRTGGDVVYEFLKVLPTLKSGVIVHIHDIFFPFEYPRNWLANKRWFWTEQYLLQSFLSFNSEFEVLLALNYLSHHYREALNLKCPIFAKQKDQLASSFWIRKR